MTSKSFPTILANVVVVFLGISAIYLLREYQPEVRPVKRATVDLSDNKDISVEKWAEIANRTDVEWLGLERSSVTDADLAKLGSMPGMAFLNLEGTKISNEGLQTVGKMQDLGWVSLVSTTIGSEGLVIFKSLPKLVDLRLDFTKIDDTAMKTLTEIPNLKMLTLSNTSITDEGLLVLAGSANLNKLDIRNTKVTKNGLAEFSKLAKSCQVLSSVGGGGGGPPGGMKGQGKVRKRGNQHPGRRQVTPPIPRNRNALGDRYQNSLIFRWIDPVGQAASIRPIPNQPG